MDLDSAKKAVEDSDVFKSFLKEAPDAFLSHFFFMKDDPVQIGFYDPSKEETTTFMIKDNIEVQPASKPLSEERPKLLEIKTVSVDLELALAKAEETRAESYSQLIAMKWFCILHTDDAGVVYNITLFTADFQTLNIRIDAVTGNVLEHTVSKLAQFD